MSRIDMKATELTNTDVNFIALVKRGANRIPFRITKGDEEMGIDLGSIGRKMFQKADAAPMVAAIVTQKLDISPAFMTKLTKSLGLDATALKKKEADGVAILAKADTDMKDKVVVQLTKSVGVVLSGSSIKKSFEGQDFKETIFKDVVGEQGYFAGPAMVASLLKRDAVSASKLPTDAMLARVQKSAADAVRYMDLARPFVPASIGTATALIKAESWADDEDDDDEDGDADSGAGDGATGPSGKAKMAKSSDGKNLSDEGDPGAKDPMIPDPKNNKTTGVDAKKADAGKNGTGAGVEEGKGTGTTPSATDDDALNTEVNATGDKSISGSNTGLPDKLKAPTKKADGTMDDDSTNGAQSALDPMLKAPTKKADLIAKINALLKASGEGMHITDVTTIDTMSGHETAAGEGATLPMTDSDRATTAGTADDKNAGGSNVTGKAGGKTIDTAGIPAKLMSPTTKNDGDADIGKKKATPEVTDDMSGAGAQQEDAQMLKGEGVMQAIQALAKSVKDGLAAVSKTVTAQGEELKKVAVMAKKTDAALNGTVFNQEPDERAARLEKSEDSNVIPLLDTAYSRRG
jgi:hypothetical protein